MFIIMSDYTSRQYIILGKSVTQDDSFLEYQYFYVSNAQYFMSRTHKTYVIGRRPPSENMLFQGPPPEAKI